MYTRCRPSLPFATSKCRARFWSWHEERVTLFGPLYKTFAFVGPELRYGIESFDRSTEVHG